MTTVPATVKWFDPTKGFGFVAPVDGSEDIFLHVSAVEGTQITPELLADAGRENAPVEVSIGPGRKAGQVQVTWIDTFCGVANPRPEPAVTTSPKKSKSKPKSRRVKRKQRSEPTAPAPEASEAPEAKAVDAMEDVEPGRLYTGTLNWLGDKEVFGWITVEGHKNVFVHHDHLPAQSSPDEFVVGAMVSFMAAQDNSGRLYAKVLSIKLHEHTLAA